MIRSDIVSKQNVFIINCILPRLLYFCSIQVQTHTLTCAKTFQCKCVHGCINTSVQWKTVFQLFPPNCVFSFFLPLTIEYLLYSRKFCEAYLKNHLVSNTLKCISLFSYLCHPQHYVFIATWDYLIIQKRNESNMISNDSTGKECLYQASKNDSHHKKTCLM